MQGHAFKENIGTRTNINNRGGGGITLFGVHVPPLTWFPRWAMQQSKASYMYVCASPPVENRDEKTGSISHASRPLLFYSPSPPTRRPPDNFIIDSKANCRSLTHLFFWIFCMLCSYRLHLFAFPSLTLRQTRDLRGILQPEQNHSRAPASKARR